MVVLVWVQQCSKGRGKCLGLKKYYLLGFQAKNSTFKSIAQWLVVTIENKKQFNISGQQFGSVHNN